MNSANRGAKAPAPAPELHEEQPVPVPQPPEDWRYYLVYLRDYAAVNGALPANFDGLVGDVLADLVDPM